MAKLQLPFWIVIERKQLLNPPEHIPCDEPLAPHIFTSAEKLTAFLKARDGGSWKVDLVSDRDGLLATVAKLHNDGISNLCVDPEPDGSEGELLAVSDALVMCAGGGSAA